MTAPFRTTQLSGAARGRLMLWVGAIVLLLQLFATVGHDHEPDTRAPECVACSVQAQPHAAPPAPNAAPGAVAWVLVQRVAPGGIAPRPASLAPYLLPQPHAPPASPLSS